MFGTDDNQQSNDDPAMLDNVKQLVSEPADQVVPAQPQYMTPSTPAPVAPSFTPTYTQSVVNDPATTNEPEAASPVLSAVAEPAQGFSSSPMPEPSTTPAPTAPQDDNTASTDTSGFSNDAPIAAAPMFPADPDQLAGMKQEALDHLEPLVGHLDQSPEEAFKTTMMMIQANDNHTLLEKALDDAKKIEDDKARANAMLDIINEINYFSQNS